MLRIEEFEEKIGFTGSYGTSEETIREFILDLDKLAAQTMGDAMAMDGSSLTTLNEREIRVYNDLITAWTAVKKYSSLSAKISDANVRHIDDQFERLNKKLDQLLTRVEALEKRAKKE